MIWDEDVNHAILYVEALHSNSFRKWTMNSTILRSVFVLSVMFVSPASANWFANPSIGINLQIGSAPNPTPDQVRSDKQPMLVRDADGNVIAMVDPVTGKMIAIAEPPTTLQKSSAVANKTTAARPVR
jgi:hypothetical protein